MRTNERPRHWHHAYATKGEREVSWHQSSPQPSLSLIAAVARPASAVVDIGGGASTLVDGLLDEGFRDVTVLDLCGTALATARARLGARAGAVQWIEDDAITWEPPASYDVWHDRATFHFLVEASDRAAYLSRLALSLKPGGHVVIATFAPDGPKRCSGLPVVRYDAETLGRTLGPSFVLVETRRHLHLTPSGATQAFLFCVFRHTPGKSA